MRHLMMLAFALAGCTINGKTYGIGGVKPSVPQESTGSSDRVQAGPGKAPVATQQHDDSTDPENEPAPAKGTGELAQLKVAADPGIATAKPQPPPWCATATKISGSWTAGGVRRTIEAVSSEGTPNLLKGAALLCQWPKDPAAAHATAAVLQIWMNTTGMSQAQAVESLTARLATDRFADDQEKLCGALKATGATEEEQEFADARQKLFGCIGAPLWSGAGGFAATNPSLVSYFDASVREIDPIVRAAHLLSRTAYARKNVDDKALLGYVTDQIDFAAMTPAAFDKALAAAPYKDNVYARTLALETRVVLANAMASIKAAVEVKAKDPAWRELLIVAPQRGAAEWAKFAVQHKDLLARSDAFQRKLAMGSRSAAAGCWPTLRKDFLDVLKAQPHATEDEVKRATNHPIASLLLSLLADCAAVDQDPAYATKIAELAAQVRMSRGPRIAAYNATLAALAKIRADKPSFAIEDKDLSTVRDLGSAAAQFIDMAKSKYDRMGWVGGEGEGIVQSATRKGDHVLVEFRPDRVSYAERACTKTNRILRINSSGVFEYEYDCRLTGGTVVKDHRPDAVKIPFEWADNIRPGVLLKFVAARGRPERFALPITTFANSSRKQLVNVYGFGL